ncbi:MAG: choice-of-anchor B family protein [Phycisphaerales bacterium]|jgi:choice-of-anchor B domain-containing protein
MTKTTTSDHQRSHSVWNSRTLGFGLAGGAALAIAFSAGGHENWRKLRDAQQAVRAPLWSLAGQAAMQGVMQDGGGEPDNPSTTFESNNVTLLSWIPLSAFPGNHNTGNDCWGYTSPSGREYAIMGLEKGFGFVEVTDPTNPVIIDWVEGPSSTWHDVKVIGQYAYGVSEGGWGIQVMDLSEIDDGRVRLVQNKRQLGHESTHNIVSNPDSGYVYLVGANIANGGLIAVSLDNPEDPTIVGQWSTHYVHDAQVVTYTDGPYAGREIAFCLNGFDGLEIIDVTDKSNMFLVGRSDYAALRYTHQAWLSEDRQYLYLNDELDEGDSVSVTTTRVFDVSDITNPTLVSTFTTGLAAVDHNNYVKGDTLYQANYRSGLRVFDLASDPLNPTEVAWFDSFPGSNSASFNGAWSTYPYFDSGIVLISDIERGLFIVDVTGDGAGRLEMTVPGGAPTELAPFNEVIQLEVNELAGMVADGSVRAHIRLPDGTELVSDMSPAGGDVYEATLPPLPCFETVEYWFEASTADGQFFRTPLSAPFVNYKALVVSEVEVAVADSFQTDTGWTVEDFSVEEGSWERGDARTSGARGEPSSDFDGTASMYATGLGRNQDLDGGPTVLTSPIYDLTALGDEARVRFAAWFTNDDGDDDSLDIEMSADGGSTWTAVESIGSQPAAWSQKIYRVADFVAVTDRFRIRFSADDQPNNSVTEAAIDAFEIVRLSCDTCRVDITGDGTLDIFDFLGFQNLFDTGDPAADFDGDGNLTIFDFLAFQSEFVLGCG